MPCTLTGSIEGDQAYVAKQNITRLAQLLCGACQLLEENNIDMSSISSEGTDTLQPTTLDEWWENHKKVDAKRKK